MRPIGIAPVPPPRLESTLPLPDGRRLGYAEYGDPEGRLVVWCHGTPGARRQFPVQARHTAQQLGLRVVAIERPGVGDSTDHVYEGFTDWARDVEAALEHLGPGPVVVAGLSGGGPYALACAHAMPDRVRAVGLLGSIVPTAGQEAVCEGLVSLSHRFNGQLTALRRPLGLGLWGFCRAANPLSHVFVAAFARLMPEGDRRVLSDRELEGVFVDDITVGSRRQFQAFVNDVLLVGREWDFRLADVAVPVRWWHGDRDPFVPLDQARRAASFIADCELYVRPGESHLGDFAAAHEVLEVLAGLLD